MNGAGTGDSCSTRWGCLLMLAAMAAGAALLNLLLAAIVDTNCERVSFQEWRDVPTVLAPWFDRYVDVFGVKIFASASADRWALQHAARVLARFLDGDEDGRPDEPLGVASMARVKAAIFLLGSESEYLDGVARVAEQGPRSGIVKNDNPYWNCTVADAWVYSELFQSEMHREGHRPEGVDDVAWEELLHLVTHTGLGCAFPKKWGFRADAQRPEAYPPGPNIPRSDLSDALDNAMGGCWASYSGTQRRKAEGCSFYFTDESCFYPCLANEYLYQVWRTSFGSRDAFCQGDLRKEFSFCTEALLRSADPRGYSLATDPMLPRVLPDGHYSPRAETPAARRR
mmetsp:Transcript_109617/g.341624  ORF Transcript_109617/g.341624 Transcript_109617/m.341624 type:complete len:341 (-) Transcript_109617:161-1183(-)